MTRREIAVLGCRILASAMIAYGWIFICYGVATGLFAERTDSFWRRLFFVDGFGAGYSLLWFAAGAIFWHRAAIYAARIFPDDEIEIASPNDAVSQVTSEDVLGVAGCVIGIWLAAPAVVEILCIATQVAVFQATVNEQELAVDSLVARILPEALRIASGVFLILRSRGMAKFVRRLRSVGNPVPIESATEQSS